MTMKQHDTYPPLTATLTDLNGPINLTTATSVKLILRDDADAVTVSGTCTIVSAAAGTVSYTWITGNTDQVGSYKGEFEITWATGKIETVPNDSYFTFAVVADLG